MAAIEQAILTWIHLVAAAIWVGGSLFIGILFGYLSAVFSVLTAKAEIRALEAKNRRISDELNDLRNVAIDEGIYDSEGGEY